MTLHPLPNTILTPSTYPRRDTETGTKMEHTLHSPGLLVNAPVAAPACHRPQAMLAGLPVELLEFVFSEIHSTSDLANVARSCKLFHEIVDPYLYRSVIVSTTKQLQSFQIALNAKPTRATITRNFLCECTDTHMTKALKDVLLKLMNLATLGVDFRSLFGTFAVQFDLNDVFELAATGEALQSLQTCKPCWYPGSCWRILTYHLVHLQFSSYNPKGKRRQVQFGCRSIFLHPTLKSITLTSISFLNLCSTTSIDTPLEKLEISQCAFTMNMSRELEKFFSKPQPLKELVVSLDSSENPTRNQIYEAIAKNIARPPASVVTVRTIQHPRVCLRDILRWNPHPDRAAVPF